MKILTIILLIVVLYIIPMVIDLFFNINSLIAVFYLGIMAGFLATLIYKSLKRKNKNWPDLTPNFMIFNICCCFLLINYYSKNLFEIIYGIDKIYHIIYSEVIKSIVYSTIAAIFFTRYTEYREYTRNYYLLSYLKDYIKKLWSLLYNIEYKNYVIYLDVTEDKIDILLLAERKEKSAKNLLKEMDIFELKKCIEEIEKILFNVYTPANQSIYYLIQDMNRIINRYEYNKYSDYNYELEDLALSISKEIKVILKDLNNFEKSPLTSIIN